MADERTNDPPINVNDEIQDRTIRHMIFLERYKAGEVAKIRKILDREILPNITTKLEQRIKRILERGSDTGPDTTKRLQELEKELLKLSQDMAKKLKAAAIGDYTLLTADEIEWQANVIKESLGFDLEMIVPNPRTVAAIAKRTSFAGSNLDQWFDSLSRANQRGVMTAVNRGVLEGETIDQIMRRVRGTKKLKFTDGVFETTRRQAETITRSAVNHVTNQARLEFFKENDDLIKGLQWVSTLDSRTSTVCAGLDGKVFPIDKGPRPPAHPNCRSTMTAVLKSFDELGLNAIPEGKRASMNGQVAASTTYGPWLRRQPIAIQEQVLGVAKAKLFRDGKLPIERFTDSRLKPLSLAQLRTLEKNAFVKAGL